MEIDEVLTSYWELLFPFEQDWIKIISRNWR